MPAALPLAGFLALAPLAVAAEDWPSGEVAAPSGLQVSLHEVIFEENPWSGESMVVVRLLAPAIAGPIENPIALRDDMDWACRTWGLRAAATLTAPPDMVVVEMMAAPVARGVASPETRQFFEQFRLDGPTCIWELF
jgi:hypothetical protein